MTKRAECAFGFLGGLTLSTVVHGVARALAQVQARVQPQLFPDATREEWFRLVPAILVAGACLYANTFRSRLALYLVLGCTLPGYAFWSYVGESGSQDAIAARRWTAAALSSGLAAIAAIFAVMLGILVAFFLASWLDGRSVRKQRGSSVAPRPAPRTILVDPRSEGAGSSFACPVCRAAVNFGASHCRSCEEPFDYRGV